MTGDSWSATILALVALAAYFCLRSYYLADPTEHRLYYSFSFLGLRKRRIAFRRGEILAVTSEGQKRRSRYSTYWVYRTIAIGLDGRRETLSNWRRSGLDTANRKAGEMGRLLDCPSRSAPEESRPFVDRANGLPELQFAYGADGPASRFIYAALALAVVLFVVILASRHR